MELSERLHRLEREARILRRCLGGVGFVALVAVSFGMAANEDQSLECTKLTFKDPAEGTIVATIQATDAGLQISRPNCEGFVTIRLHDNNASIETQWGKSSIDNEATRAAIRAGTHGSSADLNAGKDSPHISVSAAKYPNNEYPAFARISLNDGVAEPSRIELVGSQSRDASPSATIVLRGRSEKIENVLDAK